MGKTKQRKESFYNQGKEDRGKGACFRWLKHPLKKFYADGYNSSNKKQNKYGIEFSKPGSSFIPCSGNIPAKKKWGLALHDPLFIALLLACIAVIIYMIVAI